jgi:hypothetical protein
MKEFGKHPQFGQLYTSACRILLAITWLEKLSKVQC